MTTGHTVSGQRLAEAYLHECVSAWERRGLPITDLAAAAVTWGLQTASAEASPAEVAEGLQRMADAIHESVAIERRGLI